MFRNAAFELDREIGNTSAGVELVRCDDRSGWARRDACFAGPAVPARRRCGGQGQVGIDLAEKKERAGLASQRQRVLAAPAQPCLYRERHF